MKLRSLEMTNFRCFQSIEVTFHDQLTVLVAENGVGKTAILDAIAVALGPFVGGFDAGKGKGFKQSDARLSIRKGVHIQLEDANGRMEAQYPIKLVASGYIEDQFERWSRELTGKKTNTTFGKARVLTDYAKKLQTLVRDGEQIKLPIIAYYGTGRLWKQTNAKKIRAAESQSRLYGYHEALNPDSTYKSFEKWFTDKSLAEYSDIVSKVLRQKETDKKLDIAPTPSVELQHVRKAIDQCLSTPKWSTLQYDAKWRELVVRHKDGQKLHTFIPVAQLSDGVKAMLSLTADIAYRCVQLNPHFSSPTEETNGIVLIDEVDLHLHPKWQQTVLSDLQNAFPKIQFIVTTHSPQVLTSVDASSIRLLRQETDPETGKQQPAVTQITQQTRGVASSDLLAEIMGVDPIPAVPEAGWVSEYHALIQQNLHQEITGQSLRVKLEAHFGASHPVLRECDRMIRLQAFKQKLPIPKGGE